MNMSTYRITMLLILMEIELFKMTKNRKIFTIPEKYGHHDEYVNALQLVRENWKEDSVDLFNKIPYIGYLRIQVNREFTDWWYDSNDDWIQAKVVRVNEDTVDIFHYDSHHDVVMHLAPKFKDFQVRGNVLEKI